jgi:MMPL family
MLGLAVGIDYALFIVSRHRQQLAHGLEPVESVARAVATAGSAALMPAWLRTSAATSRMCFTRSLVACEEGLPLGVTMMIATCPLLLKTGSETPATPLNFRNLPIPGLAEHAVGFKGVLEAMHLRDSLLRCLEIAETLDDPDVRVQYLTFVVVGGATREWRRSPRRRTLAAEILHLYPRCAAQGMRWLLVESNHQIMREVPEGPRRLHRRGAAGTGHRGP